MKYFLFMVIMLLTFGAVNAQIADAKKKGEYLYIYGENGQKLSSMYLGTYDLAGITSSFFVVKKRDYVYVYDYNCKKISSMYIGHYMIRGASGNSFTLKRGDYIYTYDKNCNKLNSRFSPN